MKHSAKKRIEEEKKIARRKRTLRWSFVAGLILLIQAIASGFLFYSACKLGMFPTWMLSILAGVLIILLLVSTLLLIAGKKENLARNFRRFTGIILAAVMTVTSVFVFPKALCVSVMTCIALPGSNSNNFRRRKCHKDFQQECHLLTTSGYLLLLPHKSVSGRHE